MYLTNFKYISCKQNYENKNFEMIKLETLDQVRNDRVSNDQDIIDVSNDQVTIRNDRVRDMNASQK